MMSSQYPKLRTLDLRPYIRDGKPFVLVRDPLSLSDKTLLIPQPLASTLAFYDGTMDARAISAAFAIRTGYWVSPGEIDELLAALDEALLLDNEQSFEMQKKALEAYRQAPFRPSCCANQVYPGDAKALGQFLQEFFERINGKGGSVAIDFTPLGGRGLISPHIDYNRGGLVYAQIWKRAMPMIQEADLVVILGTDHNGSKDIFTLTRQNYATPFGMLPTAQDVVNTLANAIGEEDAFAGELRHQSEHSVELAAVWLQFIRGEVNFNRLQNASQDPIQIVPVLVGSLNPLANDAAQLEENPLLNRFIRELEETTIGKRVVIVAAGDLSHVGPAFGGQPVDFISRAKLKAADEELMTRICSGDAPGFYDAVRQVDDRNNVCGLTPIYLTMRLLNPVKGERVAYDLCPADEHGTSLVTICGILME
jgi:AmmeMemoRadiSam system protein B